MLPHGLHHLLGAYADVHHAVGPPRPLRGGVEEAQLHGVELQALGQLVDHGLYREDGDGCARRPVGGCLGLVVHDVVAVDLHVLKGVGGEYGSRRGRDGSAGVCPGLVGVVGVRRGHPALAGRADPDSDVASGGRAGRLQHLGPGHPHLHGAAALLRQHCGDGFEVGVQLAAEAAPNLHRDDLHGGLGQTQNPRYVVTHAEVSLAAAPDRQPAVGRPGGRRILGLDVPLVDGLRPVFTLHDHVGGLESALKVAKRVVFVAGYVGNRGVVRRPVLVEPGGVGLHGVLDVGDCRQRLVLHVYQRQGLLGGVWAGRGNCRDGVALVEDLAARQHVVGLGRSEDDILGDASHRCAKVRGCGYGTHVRVRLNAAGVDRPDDGVGVGAPEHLAV